VPESTQPTDCLAPLVSSSKRNSARTATDMMGVNTATENGYVFLYIGNFSKRKDNKNGVG